MKNDLDPIDKIIKELKQKIKHDSDFYLLKTQFCKFKLGFFDSLAREYVYDNVIDGTPQVHFFNCERFYVGG